MRLEIKNNIMGVKELILTILSMFVFYLIFINPAFATPVLFNPIPENNSYVGGGEKAFYINITESDLNASNVTLHIISLNAYERGERWDSHSMLCSNFAPSSWTCSKPLSFAIAGSDTVELFYFEATDNSRNLNSYGNDTNPLRFTLDRNPPGIAFASPLNNSYVSGTERVELQVSDVSSGVNDSTVAFSTDNSTWQGTSKNARYSADWNSTLHENNESVILYAKAFDNVENAAYEWINVTVDNELPSISVIAPEAGQELSGIVLLNANFKDRHSGIDNTTAYYTVDAIERRMDCSGKPANCTCDEYFDTTAVADGTHAINFTVRDMAGNFNSTSVSVMVDNAALTVSITNPANNAYVRGGLYVNATLVNPEKASGVRVRITAWYNMSCSDSRCSYLWNTTGLTDGAYDVFVNATHSLSYLVNDSTSVTVDNTKPKLLVDSPAAGEVSGTIYPKLIATDEYGVNSSGIRFEISGLEVSNFSYGMSCSEYVEGKKYVCGGNFDTTAIADGNYQLQFFASDLAGNDNSTTIALSVNNAGATTTTSTIAGTTTTALPTSTTIAPGQTTTTLAEEGKGVFEVFETAEENKLIVYLLVVLVIGLVTYFILKKVVWNYVKKLVGGFEGV